MYYKKNRKILKKHPVINLNNFIYNCKLIIVKYTDIQVIEINH